MKYENDLENKRRQMKIKIEEKKDEKNFLIKQICDMEKEIADLNLDLELHNNYGKNSNIENTISEIEKFAQKKKYGRKGTMGEKSLILINSLRVSINKIFDKNILAFYLFTIR